VLYLGAAALVMNVLGAVYVFSTGPLYPFYAALPRGADTTPLLVDQHLAGAAMDVPNTIVFFMMMINVLWRWLESDERERSAERAPGSSTAHISGVAAAPRPPGGVT
jgi:cytochrome c oxidase assembly factor CtaG